MDLEPVLLRYAPLQFLYLFVFELDDPAASGADEMVVVSFGGIVFETGNAILKAPLMGQPGLSKQFHRTVDRGISDSRIGLFDE